MPLPKPGEATIGGHAVVAVGYSDPQSHVIVRNSWGPSWGDCGYFYLP
jgi:C1A family cysteine protease